MRVRVMRVVALSILCTHPHASSVRSMQSINATTVPSNASDSTAVNVTKTGSALDAIGGNDTAHESVASSSNATTATAISINGTNPLLLPDHASVGTDASNKPIAETSNTTKETASSKSAPTAEATTTPSNAASKPKDAHVVANESNAIAPNATIGEHAAGAGEPVVGTLSPNNTVVGTSSPNNTQPVLRLDHPILCPAVHLLNGHCDKETPTTCACKPGYEKTGSAKCSDTQWVQLPQCHAGTVFETRRGVFITLNVDLPRKTVEKSTLSGEWDAAMSAVLRNLFGHDTSKIMRVADRTTPTRSSVFFYMEGSVEEASLVPEQTRLSALLKDMLSLNKPPRVELLKGDVGSYVSHANDSLTPPQGVSSDAPSLVPVFVGCAILAILVVVLYCTRGPEARRKYLRNRVQPKVHGRLLDEDEANDDFEFELMR